MSPKSRFNLMFNQLYVIDEQKIKQINPDLIIPKLDDVIVHSIAESIKPMAEVLEIIPSKKIEPVEPVNDTTLATEFSIVFDKMQNCTLCELCDSRQNVVIERGQHNARVMIVGDYPTQDDDKSGVPFSNSNGELLNKMIQAMKLDYTNDVYITNLMKCKPKANSEPTSVQINLCKNYLLNQIAYVKPSIIIILGRITAQTLLNNNLSIKDMRNKINYYQAIPVIVSYSVDSLNRYPGYKKETWEDLQLAMTIINMR